MDAEELPSATRELSLGFLNGLPALGEQGLKLEKDLPITHMKLLHVRKTNFG